MVKKSCYNHTIFKYTCKECQKINTIYSSIEKIPALFKVFMMGEKDVGKSTFASQSLTKTFDLNYKMTIGVEWYLKYLEIDGREVTLQIWIPADKQRQNPLLENYLIGSSAIFFLFDVSNLSSLDEIDSWMELIRKICKGIPVMLLGNKADLTEHLEDAKALAEAVVNKHALMGYYEISALKSKNTELILITMVETLLKRCGL